MDEEHDIFADLTDLAAVCSPMNVRGVAAQRTDAVRDVEGAYGRMGTERTHTLGARENECLNTRMMMSLEDGKHEIRRARTPLHIPGEEMMNTPTPRGYTHGRARVDHAAITSIASVQVAMDATDDVTPASRLASPFASALVDATTRTRTRTMHSPQPTAERKRKTSPEEFDISAPAPPRGIIISHRNHCKSPVWKGNEAARGRAARRKDTFIAHTIPAHARGTLAGNCREIKSETISITTPADERQMNNDILPRSNGSTMFTSRRKDKAPVQYGGMNAASIGRHQPLHNQSDQHQRDEDAITLETRALSSPPSPSPSPSARRRLSFSTSNDTSPIPVYEKNALDSMHGGGGGDVSSGDSTSSTSIRNGSLGIYEHALELIRSLRHNHLDRAYVIYDMSESAKSYGSSMASIIVRHDACRKHTGRSGNAHCGDVTALSRARDLSKKRFYDVMNILAGMNMIIRIEIRKKRFFSINHTFDTGAIRITTRMWSAKV